jgi:hypothetical protein
MAMSPEVRCPRPSRVLAHAGYSQAEAIYGYAEALSRAAGTTMDRLLRAQYFVPDIAAFPGISMAWSSRYGGLPHPFVCAQTPRPMPAVGFSGRWPTLWQKTAATTRLGARCISFPAKQPPMQ